uniref:Sushi domain containing 6 n=1 Tax=Oncorhynchus tshawytscha TaxID=74940 RepID=A0AAZ3NP57_ONCTS
MSDGMVLCETRALASSPVHRLATSVLLLLLALLPHGHASGCPRPVAVVHGELVNQTEANRGSFPPGTLLSYGCEPGYAPDGPTSITCTTAGTWTRLPLRCINTNVCPPPTEPENGGYRCHPSPCHRLTQKTVIEYFCDEGYTLKGDLKFLTCQNGEWDVPMQITCRLSPDKEPRSPLAMPTLSIVASTASSVALLLLLVVLFVLLQPKLKSFHHSRVSQASQPLSWWKGSRWPSPPMRRQCTAAAPLSPHLKSPGFRSSCLRAPRGPRAEQRDRVPAVGPSPTITETEREIQSCASPPPLPHFLHTAVTQRQY